jgi:hypothetical protein
MKINIGSHEVDFDSDTQMGDLTQIFGIGNAYRNQRGNKSLSITEWLRDPQTIEFICVVEHELGLSTQDDSRDLSDTTNTIKSPLIKTKKGRYGGTWAHLYILLDAAMYLDAKLRLDIIKIFIEGKLLEWRDKSGNEFISLNITMDTYLPDRDLVDAEKRKWLYINVATAIKNKVKPNDDSWNTASHEQLAQRADYEKRLIDLLKMGVVKDENHLLEMISKL